MSIFVLFFILVGLYSCPTHVSGLCGASFGYFDALTKNGCARTKAFFSPEMVEIFKSLENYCAQNIGRTYLGLEALQRYY